MPGLPSPRRGFGVGGSGCVILPRTDSRVRVRTFQGRVRCRFRSRLGKRDCFASSRSILLTLASMSTSRISGRSLFACSLSALTISAVGRAAGGEIQDTLELRRRGCLVFPEEHRHLILLLFHGPLRGDRDFRRRWTSCPTSTTSGRHGPALALPTPAATVLGDAERPALDVHKLGGRNPIPELGCGGQEEILAGLRDLHFGTGIRQFRALQFGMFRIDHQAFQQRQEAAKNDLLVAIAKGEVRNLGIPDGLSNARAPAEIPKGFGLQPGYR